MTLDIGTLWAERLIIEGVLGVGGMGTVYRAADTLLDGEMVALKILHPNLATEEPPRHRFINEVRLSRKVNHQNVVRTLDFGIAEQIPFFSMELIEGNVARDLCSSSLLPFARVYQTLLQIVDGLHAIHETRILHRDLKGGNVFIDSRGVVKIGDFGVACPASHVEVSDGRITGSARYLAPEVWRGQSIDYRADLYALGILSYELSIGKPPIDGESFEELMCKHLSDSIAPLNAVRAEIPRWFSDMTQRLLEKNFTARPSSAREVAELMRSHHITTPCSLEQETPVKAKFSSKNMKL